MTRRSPPPALLPLPSLSSTSPLLLLLLAPLLLALAPGVAAAPLMQVCGSQLADLLAEECRNTGYNDPLAAAAAQLGAGAAAAPARTKSMGVADACCHRGCSRRELQQYCSPADPRSSGPGGSSAPAAPPASAAADVAAGGRGLPVRSLVEKRPGGGRSSTVAPPSSPSSFQVGLAHSYFNHFVMPPAAPAAAAAEPTPTTAG